MKQALRNLLRDESGQDLIEYALVAAVLGLAAIAGMSSLASNISNAFSAVGSKLSSAGGLSRRYPEARAIAWVRGFRRIGWNDEPTDFNT